MKQKKHFFISKNYIPQKNENLINLLVSKNCEKLSYRKNNNKKITKIIIIK